MSTRPRTQRARPSCPTRPAQREQTTRRHPEIRFRIDFDARCSVGVGKIALLEAIERTGSLSQAAREIDMSYRRAWLLVASMNAEFDAPVISATVGGSGGGGASLTTFGRALAQAYRELETRLAGLAAEHMGRFAPRSAGGRVPVAGERPPRKSLARRLKARGPS